MAGGGDRLAVVGAAAAALVLGVAAGWLGARRAAGGKAPPPPVFVNPLADAKKGESLVVRRTDGATLGYTVREADPDSVLLQEETMIPGQPTGRRELRVARSFFGPLLVLEGDMDPSSAEAALRDFVLERVEPDNLYVEGLNRSVRCWKFTGRHRVRQTMTFWYSDELPCHGLVRSDAERGKMYEVTGYGWGK